MTSLPRLRRAAFLWTVAMLACAFLGMASKPIVTVRFYAEANKRDTSSFARPISFHHPAHEGYIDNFPSINERQIKAVFPFQAGDGTWGCAFALDHSGQLDLEVLSTERRGSTLVGFVFTKTGIHQVAELLIDKPILDGIISIPSGLTALEVAAITKSWPVIGQKKKK